MAMQETSLHDRDVAPESESTSAAPRVSLVVDRPTPTARALLLLPFATAEPEVSLGRQGWPFKRKVQTLGMEAARRQLTFRCEEVERQLGRCGLTARRLSTGEIS